VGGILDHADISRLLEIRDHGLSLMHLVIDQDSRRAVDKVKYLLEKGLDPNITDTAIHKDPAIVKAAWSQHSPVVEILWNHGADPFAASPQGFTVAHAAARWNEVGLLKS
jgi:ankyrin repeat protein